MTTEHDIWDRINTLTDVLESHVIQNAARGIVTHYEGEAWNLPAGKFEECATRTARVIVAACNSYRKHCGPRAVECAEGDLLGEALNILEALVASAMGDGGIMHVRRTVVTAARDALAKATPEPVTAGAKP